MFIKIDHDKEETLTDQITNGIQRLVESRQIRPGYPNPINTSVCRRTQGQQVHGCASPMTASWPQAMSSPGRVRDFSSPSLPSKSNSTQEACSFKRPQISFGSSAKCLANTCLFTVPEADGYLPVGWKKADLVARYANSLERTRGAFSAATATQGDSLRYAKTSASASPKLV